MARPATDETPRAAGRIRRWPPAIALGWRGPRPGGPEMTEVLLEGVGFGPEDRVVEIFPGFGETARQIARERPRSYTGVCPDPAAADRLARRLRRDPDVLTLLTRMETAGHYAGTVSGTATACPLPDESANVVVGEFLLTPMTTRDKAAALTEVTRLLPAGGRVGLHEICVAPEVPWGEAPAARRRVVELRNELAEPGRGAIHPLTEAGWRSTIDEAGLLVVGTRLGPLVPPRLSDILAALGPTGLPGFLLGALRGRGGLRAARGLAYAMAAYPELRAIVLVAEKPLLGDVRVGALAA